MAIKPTRGRRTKAEVQNEFELLSKEIAAEKSTTSAKLEMAVQLQEAEIKAAVSEISVEALSNKLAEFNLEVARTFSNLSEKMTDEVKLLKSLQAAVAIETRELHKLHNIDIAATNIDQLLSDYAEKKSALELEIATKVSAWEKEQEELGRKRSRENEEYEYQKTQERKKAQDTYEEQRRLTEKQNREEQELLEKSWKERENALKIREEELSSLKKEVEQFPSRLAAECTKSAKEAVKETEAKYHQEMAQLKRDLAVEKQISELKIAQLQELLSKQQSQMAAMQTQLDEAKHQVQDIAVKAIEGASGARALSHINQIAIEQAKNRPQS